MIFDCLIAALQLVTLLILYGRCAMTVSISHRLIITSLLAVSVPFSVDDYVIALLLALVKYEC